MTPADRYFGNLGAFSTGELQRARRARVGVAGCGGLGGYVINALARFGAGAMTLIDGDSFCQSNLNRQMFATAGTIGENKAEAASRVLHGINPDVETAACPVMLSENNAEELLAGCDLAVDCLDNIPARRILANTCSDLGIPLVHGAISGLYGQVACVYPGDRLLERLYPNEAAEPLRLGNPVFTAQLVASLQACEAIKLLCGREAMPRGSVLYIDLNHCSFESVSFE